MRCFLSCRCLFALIVIVFGNERDEKTESFHRSLLAREGDDIVLELTRHGADMDRWRVQSSNEDERIKQDAGKKPVCSAARFRCSLPYRFGKLKRNPKRAVIGSPSCGGEATAEPENVVAAV